MLQHWVLITTQHRGWVKINNYKFKIFGVNLFPNFQNRIVERIVWPYSNEKDSLYRWRAFVLSSILLSALFVGSFALISAATLIIKENAWGLAVVDSLGLILCLTFLFVHRIRFEIRATITLLMFFVIGTAVILSVGPLSGGPAWLFAFAVLSGVLMGNHAAFTAIVMNAVCLAIIGILITNGKFRTDFPVFSSQVSMITTGINFIVLNAITAVSVSALVKGVFRLYTKKEELADSLEKERLQLINTKRSLESEIIDRKQTEEALQESEALFKLITGHTSALVSIHDSDGIYLFASPSHSRLGIQSEELIGQPGSTMVEEEDAVLLMDHLKKAKKEKLSEIVVNFRLRDKKGHIHHFRGSFDAVFKPDGSLEKFVSVSEDITQLKEAQAQREEALSLAAEAKKLALIGQVAGKMAHDFNNILGIIMGVSELTMMNCNDREISKNLKLIFDQTIRGKNLTKNLVAFAKSQEPKQKFFKLNESIDLVLNLMKKDLENIELMIDQGSKIPDLMADPGMIEHTLVNLLQNSIHAVSKTESPWIRIKSYYRGQNICFDIEDNGCGIPEKHLKNIYEPSFTLKGSRDISDAYKSDIKGTGYGMANVKKYIEQHNGRISVQSDVNSGTKYTIRIPVINKELTIEEKAKIEREKTHLEKHILLVEDEQAIADVQYRILTQAPCKHKVDIADSGRMAMDLFDNNQYDFVSLDYILLDDKNGMDVYHHIRKSDKKIPILFISGNIEFLESIIDLKQKDLYMDHQSKPCRNMDYLNSINRLMSKVI